MISQKVNIKPLSVNKAWQGKRFKTKEYKSFETEMLLKLKYEPIEGKKYQVKLIFGFSSELSDIDNPIKMTLDILQKKYKINDRYFYKLEIEKQIVKKGAEFIQFKINTI